MNTKINKLKRKIWQIPHHSKIFPPNSPSFSFHFSSELNVCKFRKVQLYTFQKMTLEINNEIGPDCTQHPSPQKLHSRHLQARRSGRLFSTWKVKDGGGEKQTEYEFPDVSAICFGIPNRSSSVSVLTSYIFSIFETQIQHYYRRKLGRSRDKERQREGGLTDPITGTSFNSRSVRIPLQQSPRRAPTIMPSGGKKKRAAKKKKGSETHTPKLSTNDIQGTDFCPSYFF